MRGLGKLTARALPVGGLLLLIAAATAAEPPPKSRYRMGPIRLWPSLTLQALVDSNPYGAGSFGNGDLLFVVSPGLEAKWPVGSRLRLSGEGRADWNQYQRGQAVSYTDWTGTSGAELDAGRATFFADLGGYQTTQVYGIELEDGTVQQGETLGAGIRLRASRRLLAITEARYRTYRYWRSEPGSTIGRDLDRDARSGTVRLEWRLSRRTALVGSFEGTEEQFVHGVPGYPSQVRTDRWLLGLSFAPRAAVRGQLGVGHVSTPAGGIAPPYAGPLLSANLDLPVGRVARLSMGASRDTRFGSARAPTLDPAVRNTYVYTNYGLGITGELPLDLVGRASARWEEARYLVPFLAPGRVSVKADRLFEARATLGKPLRRSLWLGAIVEYSQRVANDGFGDRRWRYGLRAEFER